MFSFTGFINSRINKWLKRRMPAQKTFTLNSGNTFIFPSRAGLQFLICCFVLFLLGTNYQNNLILFLVFFLCSFMVTCLLFSYQNLAGLSLTAVATKGQFAGDDCEFHIRLSANKIGAKQLDFMFKDTSSALQSVINEQRVVLYAFSKNRGYFNPGRVTIRSTFPFGLFTVWTHLDFGFKVLLYPHPLENNIQLPHSSDNAFNTGFNKFTMGADQFSMLKSYQQGESLKSVAWKQLAQGRGWLSKQFEQPLGADILLDIHLLAHLPLEVRLSYLSHQIIELEKMHERYALNLYEQYIETGSGDRHQHLCLQALALVNAGGMR